MNRAPGEKGWKTVEANGGSRTSAMRFEPDWDAIAESPEFRELERSRRHFLVPATAFFSAYFLVFLCLLAFAPDAMAKHAIGSISYALLAGVSVVLVGFVMAWLYTRKSAGWAELSERVAATARRPARGGAR